MLLYTFSKVLRKTLLFTYNGKILAAKLRARILASKWQNLSSIKHALEHTPTGKNLTVKNLAMQNSGVGERPFVFMHPPATLHFKNVESPLLTESDLFIFELGFGV